MSDIIGIVGLFCRAIRQDQQKMDALDQIYPDTMVLPKLPHVIPLCFYSRAHLPLDTTIKLITYYLRTPDGSERQIGAVDAATIDKAIVEARNAGAKIGCIITRAVTKGFAITQAGRLDAIARADGVEYICATLGVEAKPALLS